MVLLGGAFAEWRFSVAQGDEARKLWANFNGDLWEWNRVTGRFLRRTQSRLIANTALSPDGTRIAYTRRAQQAQGLRPPVDAPQSALPSDIYLFDTATYRQSVLTPQPDDFSYYRPNRPNRFAVRGAPAWSPDGNMLAWTEVVAEGDSVVFQLAIYDFTAKTQVVSAVIDEAYDVIGAVPVEWGMGGIALIHSEREGNPGEAVQYVLAFTPDGKALLREKLNASRILWITDGDEEYLFVEVAEKMADGQEVFKSFLAQPGAALAPFEGFLEVYSPVAPDGVAYFPGEVVRLTRDLIRRFTIAPDGQQYAATERISPTRTAIVVHDGEEKREAIRLENDTQIVLMWGTTGVRVRRR